MSRETDDSPEDLVDDMQQPKDPEPVAASERALIDPKDLKGPKVEAIVLSYLKRLPVTIANAWLHYVRLGMWIDERSGLPAVVESNAINDDKHWRSRAEQALEFLSKVFEVPAEEVPNYIDLAMRSNRAHCRVEDSDKNNRPNISGDTFQLLTSHLLIRVAGFPERRVQMDVSGFTDGIKGGNRTSPDTVLYRDDAGTDPSLIISSKRSMRGDREKQCESEGTTYGSIYPKAKFVVVTGDLMLHRVKTLIFDHREGADRRFSYDVVYHTAMPLLRALYRDEVPNDPRFRDISELLTLAKGLI